MARDWSDVCNKFSQGARPVHQILISAHLGVFGSLCCKPVGVDATLDTESSSLFLERKGGVPFMEVPGGGNLSFKGKQLQSKASTGNSRKRSAAAST